MTTTHQGSVTVVDDGEPTPSSELLCEADSNKLGVGWWCQHILGVSTLGNRRSVGRLLVTGDKSRREIYLLQNAAIYRHNRMAKMKNFFGPPGKFILVKFQSPYVGSFFL